MEDKIEVGEYVRTKQGYIYKVKRIFEDMIWVHDIQWIPQPEIVKHSKNIIDLIEVGDVIIYNSNYLGREIKMEVNYTCKKEEDYKWGEGYVDTVIDEHIMLEDIKSIVTKEQFEAIEYKVKE